MNAEDKALQAAFELPGVIDLQVVARDIEERTDFKVNTRFEYGYAVIQLNRIVRDGELKGKKAAMWIMPWKYFEGKRSYEEGFARLVAEAENAYADLLEQEIKNRS